MKTKENRTHRVFFWGRGNQYTWL